MKFDTETEAAIVNFSKGYCQSKGLEMSRWEEVAEFVKERFTYHHKDSKFNDLEVGKASFFDMIDCMDFERKVIEQTIKEMNEKFANNSLDKVTELMYNKCMENKDWVVKEGDIVTKIEPREEPFTFTLQFANGNGEVYANVDVIYDNSDGGVLSRFRGIPKHPGQVQVWKANKLLRDRPFGEKVVWSNDLPWDWELMKKN